MREKVLLITPPYHCGVVESAGVWLPIGLLYLAEQVKKAGFEPVLYDAMSLNTGFREIGKIIEEEQPFAVCSGAFTASLPDCVEILKIAKKINKNIYTIIGGVHPSFMYEEVLKMGGIDFVVRFEGEITLRELLMCLKEKDNTEKVKGICYRDGENIIKTGDRLFKTDLDDLKPDFDIVDWEHYIYRAEDNARLAVVSSSRGCTQNCSFCSQKLFWNQTWRGRSPENFVNELDMLADKFGVEVVMIADETPTYDEKRWIRILDLLIERNIGIKILLETRADDILRDRDILWKYKTAGIEHIYTGVESAEQATLDYYKKEISINESKESLKLINEHDIITETSFVIGMPNETIEKIHRTSELAEFYEADMTFFLALAPWPYSDIYDEVKDRIITKDYRKYNLIEPVIEPYNITIEELKRELALCSMNFFKKKFSSLYGVSEFKKRYMISVLNILKDNSYLKENFKEIFGSNAVKQMMVL